MNAPTDGVLGKLPDLVDSPFALNFLATKLMTESKVTSAASRDKNGHSTFS